MINKQIIIDGVDVSGCECYNPNIKMDCLLHPLQSGACKNNPNCHYKLYKRKKQELTHFKKENERLLQTIIKDQAEIVQKNIDETNILLIKENMDLQQQLKAKEQECEELKIYIESNEQQVKEVETLVMDNDRLINELNQLKQTLTKIKEILLFNKKELEECLHNDIDGQILKIIREVQDAD